MQMPFLAPMTVWATAGVGAHEDATAPFDPDAGHTEGKVERHVSSQLVVQVPASPTTSGLQNAPTQQAQEQMFWLLAARSGRQIRVPVNTVTPTAKGVVEQASGLHA